MEAHGERTDLPDAGAPLSVTGRIIGRRKASANLLFLDLESNGHRLQVMVDGQKLLKSDQDAAGDDQEMKSIA